MILSMTYQSEDGTRRANIVRKGECSWLVTRWKKLDKPKGSRRYGWWDAADMRKLTAAQQMARIWCATGGAA